MKIAHVACLLSPQSGIVSQMEDEQVAADKLNIPWHTIYFCYRGVGGDSKIKKEIPISRRFLFSKNLLIRVFLWARLRYHYNKWLMSLDVDVYVVRYSVVDPFQAIFALRTRRPIYFIHHTFELHELRANRSVVFKIGSFAERLYGRYIIRRSRAIIGVTQEIVNYEKKRIDRSDKSSFIYPNGKLYDIAPVEDSRKAVQEWIFIASKFYPWTGLDLLVDKLQQSNLEVVLHVVGEVDAKYMREVSSDNRIVFHGHMRSDEIHSLASSCWLGISALALYRKGMKEACPLKVREYLCMGVPVVAGHDDVFPDGFPYFLNSGYDLDRIFEFGNRNRFVSRQEVSLSSKKYIDKSVLLNDLYGYIQDNVSSPI